MEVQPRTLKLNTPAEAWFQTKPETTGPGASAEPLDVNGQLGRQLLDAAQRAGSVTELVGMLTRAVQAHSECLGLWLAPKRTSEDAAPEFRSLLDQGENPLWHAVESQIAELARRAQETGELQVSRVGSNPRRMLALVPLRTGGKADELLAGCFERVNGSSLPPGLLLLLVAQAIAQWRKRRAADSLNQINLTFRACIGGSRRSRTWKQWRLAANTLPVCRIALQPFTNFREWSTGKMPSLGRLKP